MDTLPALPSPKGGSFYEIPCAFPRRSHRALQHAWAGSGRHPAGPGGRDPAGHRDRHRPRHQLLRPLRRRSQDLRAFGQAIRGRREQVFFQLHLGAVYNESGEYGWSRDLSEIQRTFAWELETLGTDYADFGFLHCVDELADIDALEKNGILEFAQSMRRAGDALAASHYGKLSVNASACISCGHCAARCPFGVDQPSRMEEIARYFA